MIGFDPARTGYYPAGSSRMVTLTGRPVADIGAPDPEPPAPVVPAAVTLSASTQGRVATVNLTGEGPVNLAAATWVVQEGTADYGSTKMTGPVCVFRHTDRREQSSTVTVTVPRTDGGPALVRDLAVPHAAASRPAGTFPDAFTWTDRSLRVEHAFRLPTSRTVRARLVRTSSPGVVSERVTVEEVDVAFTAQTVRVVTTTLRFPRLPGNGDGWEFEWVLDLAPGVVATSGPLPVWVYGEGLSRQSLSAAPEDVNVPGIYSRPATDSGQVTPASGRTYAQHVSTFLSAWKAENLSAPVGGAWLSFQDYNTQLHWVDLDDPTVPRVTFKHWDQWEWGWTLQGWYGRDDWVRPYPRDKVAVDVPVPAWACPSPGTDRSMCIVGMRNGQVERIWEFWLAQKMGDGSWRAASIGSTTRADRWRHSASYTVAASGISSLAYTLRVSEAKRAVDYIRAERAAGRTPSEDVIAGMIPHALAINLPDPRGSGLISYPATFTDGSSSDTAMPWEGQLVYVRPDANIAAANLPPLHHAIAVAAKRYGMRVTDKTYWSTTLIVEGDDTYGGGLWQQIRGSGESWALRWPDDWFVIGRQYTSEAAFDADTTTTREVATTGGSGAGVTVGVWPQGSTRDGWLVEYNGGGTVARAADGVIELKPPYVPLSTTTAALVTSTATTTGDVVVNARMRTLAQRPDGNTWEVAWLMWNYSRVPDPNAEQGTGTNDGWSRRGYYLALKPNGWELGKLDQSLFTSSGGQRWLATGTTPTYPLGTSWRDVEVRQTGATIVVRVGGATLATFTDGPSSNGWTSGEAVYTSGAVALYTEDAHVEFTDVRVTAP